MRGWQQNPPLLQLVLTLPVSSCPHLKDDTNSSAAAISETQENLNSNRVYLGSSEQYCVNVWLKFLNIIFSRNPTQGSRCRVARVTCWMSSWTSNLMRHPWVGSQNVKRERQCADNNVANATRTWWVWWLPTYWRKRVDPDQPGAWPFKAAEQQDQPSKSKDLDRKWLRSRTLWRSTFRALAMRSRQQSPTAAGDSGNSSQGVKC